MIVAPPDRIPSVDELGAVHFIGIGGAGLSAIARLMAARGVRVTGSDASPSAALESLALQGVRVQVGHDKRLVEGADVIVVSTAVPDSNVEVIEARRLEKAIWPRSAAMQSLMAGSRSVVVTGTHGKTTTTGMLVTALRAAGADPSFTVGSTLMGSGINAAWGSDDIFVAEGDESDAAILTYTPFGAVVTNVDVDHLDFYGSPEAYAAAFDAFVDRVDPAGFVVCGVDDPGGMRLAERASARGLHTVTVGHGEQADLRLVPSVAGSGAGPGGADSLATVSVVSREGVVGALALRVPGSAYELDAGAAAGAGLALGHAFEGLARGLAEYLGTGRRMEAKGEAGGVRVYDSYAHHPVEIRGDLSAARSLAAPGRLVVCFQPHLFSRTAAFAAEMGHELGAADVVVVLDVYPAREQPIAGVSGALVADAVPLPRSRVRYVPAVADAADALVDVARPGDLVLTLGAGDVTVVGPRLLDRLRSHSLDSQTVSSRNHEESP